MVLGREIPGEMGVRGVQFVEGEPAKDLPPIPPEAAAMGFPTNPAKVALLDVASIHFSKDFLGGNYAK